MIYRNTISVAFFHIDKSLSTFGFYDLSNEIRKYHFGDNDVFVNEFIHSQNFNFFFESDRFLIVTHKTVHKSIHSYTIFSQPVQIL